MNLIFQPPQNSYSFGIGTKATNPRRFGGGMPVLYPHRAPSRGAARKKNDSETPPKEIQKSVG